MKKSLIFQLLIIIVALIIVLPLALSIRSPTTVTVNDQEISGSDALKAITFELQRGQMVNGSLTYYTFLNDTWIRVSDSNGYPLEAQYILHYTSEQNRVTFKFIAPTSGIYHIGVGNNHGWTENIDYSYTISPPSVLGLDPLVLIILIIAVVAVLTGINIYVNWIRHRKVIGPLAVNS